MKWELDRIKVLFVCVHNSARSQMAEEFLRLHGGEEFSVESAGLEPTEVLSDVIKVMKEKVLDLSGKETKDVWDLFRKERQYDWVITVCDRKWEDKCPTFPGIFHRANWGFADPSRFDGPDDERLEYVREIRNKIELRIKLFIDEAREQKKIDDAKRGSL